MKKINKKGFTLIELLAVIIILAVIALIATPIALDVVESAKKSSFESTAYGIIDAVKLKTMEDRLNQTILSNEYTFPSDELEVQGKEPNGSVVVDNEGRIAIALYHGKWCATKSYLEGTVNIKEYVEGECELPFVMLGDVNSDGIISSTDINRLKVFLKGLIVLDFITALDVNQDGIVNQLDRNLISDYYGADKESYIGNVGTMVPINPNIKVEYESVLVGDLNEDSLITSADVEAITNILNKTKTTTPRLLTLSDVNKDLVVNELDIEILTNYINNVEDNRTQYINTSVQINPNIKVEYSE